MPKINVYLPDELAAAVKEAKLPVSAICQSALERAVRDVTAADAIEEPPATGRPGRGLFSRFTPRAVTAVSSARDIARDRPASEVGTEHLLLALLRDPNNLAYKVLQSLDVDPDDVRDEVEASLPEPAGKAPKRPRFSLTAKLALKESLGEALSLGHNYIGCEHLLLGVLATEDGLGSAVLRRMGLELRTTRKTVGWVLAGVVHGKALASGPAIEPDGEPVDPDLLRDIVDRLDALESRLHDQ